MRKSWIILIAIALIGFLAVKLRRAPPRPRPNVKPPKSELRGPVSAETRLMEECKQSISSQNGRGAFPIHDDGQAKALFIRSFYCEALAKKDPTACSYLDKNQWTTHGKTTPSEASECRTGYFMNMAMASGAAGKRGKAVALCEKSISSMPYFRPSAHRELCPKLITAFERRNGEGVCDQAVPALKPGISVPDFLRDCRESFRGLGGPGECAEIPIKDLDARTSCFDVSAILSASAAQTPSLCHGSELCEALMTSSDSTYRPLRERAANVVCSIAVQHEMRYRSLSQAPAHPAANP